MVILEPSYSQVTASCYGTFYAQVIFPKLPYTTATVWFFMKVFVIIVLLLLPVSAFADDGVLRLHDHTFSTDQTWSGNVVIDGVVRFAPEATLTVMPGTVVEF